MKIILHTFFLIQLVYWFRIYNNCYYCFVLYFCSILISNADFIFCKLFCKYVQANTSFLLVEFARRMARRYISAVQLEVVLVVIFGCKSLLLKAFFYSFFLRDSKDFAERLNFCTMCTPFSERPKLHFHIWPKPKVEE